MKESWRWNNQIRTRLAIGRHQQEHQASAPREEGQAMLEMTVGTVFLLIIVLILFEMAMLFYSYIAVLNASREGAVYASIYPTLTEDDPRYEGYLSVTSAEAHAAGLNTDPAFFTVEPPDTPLGIEPLPDGSPAPVIVRVHYQLINPTQGIVLPFLGRMGLFQSVWMSGVTEMPIR